jgi:hypothetical protein
MVCVTKVKLHLTLYLRNYAARQGRRGSGGIAPPFLIPAVDGGEWSASPNCRFTPVPIGWEAGWTQEPVWATWRKFLTVPGLQLRSLGPPACSQSLYRLKHILKKGCTLIRCRYTTAQSVDKKGHKFEPKSEI